MIYYMQQGTEEWHAIRCGKITASRIGDIMAKTKTGEAASVRNYRAELVAELLTGMPTDGGFVSTAMRRGTEQEPNARFEYEMRVAPVQQVGFITSSEIEYTGASPDGLVGDDGGIEIKCPNTATHIETLRTGKIERCYQLQMQWNMYCSGRQWWDFVSYDPRIRDRRLQIAILRVKRDPSMIQEIATEVRAFWRTVEMQVDELTAIAEVSA